MKAEAKSVGDISPDDISPEISDNRFQSAEGKVLPNFEVDMSISDQSNGKLSIDEDFELTSDGDIILIGTVQGQYIQGTPILNENGQLNKIPNRDQGIIMRVDRTTKKWSGHVLLTMRTVITIHNMQLTNGLVRINRLQPTRVNLPFMLAGK